MATCAEVMTREPACCEPADSIKRVAQLMKTEDIGALPVVESRTTRRLLGIVTDRDLVVKVLADGRAVDGATVRDAMTADPVTCREDADVSEAVTRMADR
jgi:CBS domain-containing protein